MSYRVRRWKPGPHYREPVSSQPRATLAQLRTLLAVIDGGSFSEAALELDLSQSSVSHAIAELERSLGARLLDRGRHGARATELGRRIAAHARAMVASLEALEQEVQLEHGELTGRLRIASVRSAATLLLPPVIRAFRTNHPAVRFAVLDLEAEVGGIEAALTDGRADLGLLSLPTTGGLIEWELTRDEYLVLWPDEPRANAPGWAELAARPFIQCDVDCARRIGEHLDRHGLGIEPAYAVREDSVILSMVAHGLGVSVLPRLAVEPLPAGVRAYPLPVPLERRLGAAVAPARASSPLVQAFLAALRAGVPTGSGPAPALTGPSPASDGPARPAQPVR